MIEDLDDCRTATCYSSFESRVLNDLARLYPDLEPALKSIKERLVDLEPIVRKGYVHPEFGGRSSIKVVLPVIAPDLSYGDLVVSDGGDAIAAFARMMLGEVPDAEIEQVRADLLAYCETDTLAMVRLHEFLAKIKAAYLKST